MSSTAAASPADLQFGLSRERIAADLLRERLWPTAALKPRARYSNIDFGVVADEKPVCFLEIKNRRNASTDFDQTILYVGKHTAAVNLQTQFNVRTLCLIVFSDRAGYFYLDEAPDKIDYVRRADRNWQPVEHAFYAHSRFVWLEDDFVAQLNERLLAQSSASERTATPQCGQLPQ